MTCVVNSLKQRACLWSVSILDRFTAADWAKLSWMNFHTWSFYQNCVFAASTTTSFISVLNSSLQPIGLRCLQWQKRKDEAGTARERLFVLLNAVTPACFHLTEHGPLGENTLSRGECGEVLVLTGCSVIFHISDDVPKSLERIRHKWDASQTMKSQHDFKIEYLYPFIVHC